jgi:hypothetical protein
MPTIHVSTLKKIPIVSAEESSLIPLVRYQIYYNKKKKKYYRKYQQTTKCREPQYQK